MTIYRSVSEIAGDICKTFPPIVYNAPLRGFRLEFCNEVGIEKNRNDTPTTHILKIMFSGSGHFLLLCSPKNPKTRKQSTTADVDISYLRSLPKFSAGQIRNTVQNETERFA